MKYAECCWTWRRGFSSPTISPTNNLPQSAFPFIVLQNKNPAIQRITGFFIVFHQTFVELEGVEPSSKQGTRRLSTCLSVISSFSPYPAYGSPIRSPVRKISPRTPGHAPQPASHCRYPDASRTRSGSCRRGTRPRTSLGTGIKVMLLSKITQRVHSYYCHLYV